MDIQREEFLSLPIGGGTKTYSIEGVGEDFVDNCSSGQGRSLEFSLVQVLTGGVVRHEAYLMDSSTLILVLTCTE